MSERVVAGRGSLVTTMGVAVLALVWLAPMAQAQVMVADGPRVDQNVIVRVAGSPEGEGAAVRSFAWTEHDTVTQSPYSAEAVTEVTQTLADGNRINRRTVSRIYRDAAGRVRREQSISGIGPIGAAAEGARIVFINDPVAKAMYTLDPQKLEARKLPVTVHLMTPGVKVGEAVEHDPGAHQTVTHEAGVQKVERTVVMVRRGEGPDQVGVSSEAPKHLAVFAATGDGDPVATPHGPGESLGTRTIEGVEAEGTRWAKVIAAGAVGNERPIEVVTERWYSPALKAVVLAKHSDPRLGDTVYQLTNIVRQEPPPDLFTVPSDYKVVEGNANMKFSVTKKAGQE